MADALNPYREWLELDTDAPPANHYELLELDLFEADTDTIHQAADRALARVRGHRPGSHAAAWAQLLDELSRAKDCLIDTAQKKHYDATLRAEANNALANTPASTVHPTAGAATAPVNKMPDLFPPGMEPTAETKPARNRQREEERKPERTGNNTASTPSPRSGPAPHVPAPHVPAPHVPDRPLPATGQTSAGSATHQKPETKKLKKHKQPPPPAPESAVPTGGRLLADPYESCPTTGVKLFDEAEQTPVNAHVAPPREEKSSILPIALCVAAVLILLSIIVAFLAIRSTANSGNPPPTTGTPGVAQLPAGGKPINEPVPKGRVFDNQALDNQARSGPTVTAPVVPSPGLGRTRQPAPNGTAPAPAAPSNAGNGTPGMGTGAATPVAPQPSVNPKVDPPAQAAPQETAEPAKTVRSPSASSGAPAKATTGPSQSELRRLGQALSDAQTAMGKQDFRRATADLKKAEAIAVTPEHQAMVARLEQLAKHSEAFWNSVLTALKGFQGVEELTFGTGGLVVLVVDSGPDWIVIRRQGRNQRYSLATMPPGLALAIAKTRLDVDQADHLLQLGACLATVADRKPIYLDEARKYWGQAQARGTQVDSLLRTLTDSYDLVDSE